MIFGTLFVLDLVPIMAKIFTRAGPYDVLVEHPEFIANENLAKYQRAYRSAAWDGAEFWRRRTRREAAPAKPQAAFRHRAEGVTLCATLRGSGVRYRASRLLATT